MKNFNPGGVVRGPSLVRAREWMEWLDYWMPTLRDSEGWVTFLIQSVINLHQTFVIMSRRLRKNPTWDPRGSMGEVEWEPCANVAEERLAWFRKNKPSSVAQSLVPPWAALLFDAVEGALMQMVRIGREIDQIRRKGHLLINVSPFAPTATTFDGDETT